MATYAYYDLFLALPGHMMYDTILLKLTMAKATAAAAPADTVFCSLGGRWTMHSRLILNEYMKSGIFKPKQRHRPTSGQTE